MVFLKRLRQDFRENYSTDFRQDSGAHTSTYINIHTHTYTYIHIHTHTYTYIYIHTHTYTYIHIHTHTNCVLGLKLLGAFQNTNSYYR